MRRWKRRKAAGYVCLIKLNDVEFVGRIDDISPGGARVFGIEPTTPRDTPLVVSWNGGKSVRSCQVMWTQGRTAGVKFIK